MTPADLHNLTGWLLVLVVFCGGLFVLGAIVDGLAWVIRQAWRAPYRGARRDWREKR